MGGKTLFNVSVGLTVVVVALVGFLMAQRAQASDVPSPGPVQPLGSEGVGRSVADTGASFAATQLTSGSSLESSNASFIGQAVGDQAGTSVAIAGDVNKDGYADLVTGAPGYSANTGRVYIFLGGPSGWQLNEGLASADATCCASARTGDRLGISVAGAGDVNNDDHPDLLIGSPGVSSDTGQAVLIYGSDTIPLGGGTLVPNGTLSGGVDGNRMGESVSGAGDVNDDGYDDVLIGSPGYNAGSGQGEATLWTGATVATSMTITSYAGVNAGDLAGSSVSGAGDVNGDGYADMLVGAPGYNSSAGQVYLVLGSSAPSDSSLSNADVPHTGVSSGGQAGYSVSTGGDVNGDGDSDFVVGAPGYDSDRGKAYLLFSNLVGICSIPRSITCGQQVSGDTTGSTSHHLTYSCEPWAGDESGPEVIYSLSLPDSVAPYTVTATLSDLGPNDLDVFILSPGGCETGACATASSYGDLEAPAIGVTGGTYYIAVDGYNGAAGSYTLSVACQPWYVHLPLVLRNQ
jgi:hypothetical protein